MKLPTRVDLSTVSSLVEDLRKAEGSLSIDGQDVTLFGALGLQALIAASRHMKERGDAFYLENPSEKMIEHMTLMGVTPEQLVEGTV